MGIEYNALKSFIILQKKLNANFYNFATLGRQGLHIKQKKLKNFFKKNKIFLSDEKLLSFYKDLYSENLIKFFGAENIDSFDISDYEKATIVHDMNNPIDKKYFNKYNIIFDGGTLEHVFNFPVAIKNCMQMIKIGGYFISITCCNNFSGHGFYQFSPELFFRIFNKDNGFKIYNIYINDEENWYSVKDPEEIKSRVIFKNNKETYLIVIAQKIDDVEIFSQTPMQSDYVSLWDKNLKQKNDNLSKRLVSFFYLKFLRKIIKYDRKFFKKER